MDEAKKRDYKAEYKKFQSSTKAKKYRAELNKYNRQKGTYGNGDKKDASHKGGKIVGFENQSKNRGRAEKSRLKKESKELQRWKVYIKGEKEPLILTGKDKNSVKKFAHQMIKNNKVKIARVVKEGFAGNLKGKKKENFVKRVKELSTQLGYRLVENKEGKLNEFGTDISALNLGGNFHIHPERKKQTNQGQYLQGYSTKEARAIIDGELKKWAKQLRKVEYNVIKDWMKAAKQGSIDFFDLIRGLKTGDIARAHPYETEFLVKLLTRDKIIKRFRSYFAGKKGKPGRTK